MNVLMGVRTALVSAAFFLVLFAASAQTPSKSHKSTRTPSSRSSGKSAAAVRSSPLKKSGHAVAAHTSSTSVANSRLPTNRGRTAKGRYATRLKKPPAPTYQLHPDPERYQQIQRALADRGFFKGQADGIWNDDSVQALRDFQTANQLDSDGKINALSLMKLGLGPKHDGSGAPLSGVGTGVEAPGADLSPAGDTPLPPPPASLPPDATAPPE